jgi:UDP-glucose 4-epimerase
MGSDLEIEHGPERKVNAVGRRLAGTSKASELLGFRAQVSLEEGLGRLVQWWRSVACAPCAPCAPFGPAGGT